MQTNLLTYILYAAGKCRETWNRFDFRRKFASLIYFVYDQNPRREFFPWKFSIYDSKIFSSYLDLSLMLTCLGGILVSEGGDVAGDPWDDPQELDPECEDDMELVLWRFDGIPWLSLLFTIYKNRTFVFLFTLYF